MAGDVRRLPARTFPADGRALRAGRPRRGLRELRRREATGRRDLLLPASARHRTARGQPGRPAGRGDRRGPVQPQERDPAAPDPRGRGGGISGLGALCACRPRRRSAPCGRDVERQLPRRARRGGDRGPVRGAHRRPDGRAGAPAGQACPRRLPGRGAGPRTGAQDGRGLRGRAGRRGGRPGRRIRVRGRGGPARAGGRAGRARRGRGGDRPRRVAGPPVINHPVFHVEPWCLREKALDLDLLAQTESVFALSNGHIGWRANLDEGEPHGLPGSYLNGVYESWPLVAAEAAYGLPQSGQTVVNITNGKLIRLFVDDEPFDVRYGTLRSHERVLDFRSGVLRRRAEWVSPAGAAVRVTSARLVSFTQRAIAAIRYEVEPLDGPVRVALQSELLANEQLPADAGDPRHGMDIDHPLVQEFHAAHDQAAVLVHRTARSGLRIGAAMDHLVDGPDVRVESQSFADGAVVTAAAVVAPGQRLSVIKFVAYGWSGVRSLPGVRDQVWAALTAARQAGWDGLLAEQRSFLDDFWDCADVELDGDAEVQQAVRFGLFQVLQAGARGENRPIPAKGRTGPGYDGHTFWDSETFVLPVLTLTAPDAAASALQWRHSSLPTAVERAAQLGYRGAAFPWRTINGEECSGYWPAGTAAFHVNADIADAVVRYVDATGDAEFDRTTGMDLLAHTARLWRSLGHHDAAGRFHLDGVTGPDEYSAIA